MTTSSEMSVSVVILLNGRSFGTAVGTNTFNLDNQSTYHVHTRFIPGHPDTAKTFVDISWIKGTVEDWIYGSAKMTKTGLGALHTMQPAEILINGSRAIATTTISIRARILYKGCDLDLESWAHQLQRFEKVIGNWKLVRFQAVYIRDSVSTPFPGLKVPELDEEAQAVLSKARPPFKWLAWQMSLIGETVRSDLPGYDDEKTWEPLVESNERWLETGRD